MRDGIAMNLIHVADGSPKQDFWHFASSANALEHRIRTDEFIRFPTKCIFDREL